MAGADGDGQRVYAGVFHKLHGFVYAGEQLAVVEHAFGTHAVFFTGHAGFQIAQYADFAFHRHAAGMGKLNHGAGNVDIVGVVGGGFAVAFERAVHHHRRKTQLDGALAYGRAHAVVLVHHHRDMRKFFDGGQNQVAQKCSAGVFACACTGLHNHRRVYFTGRFHNGAHLFEVVDIKRGQAVLVLGGVIQQLA